MSEKIVKIHPAEEAVPSLVSAKKKIPEKWPTGYCFICCRPIDEKRKLCEKHRSNKKYEE